MSKRNAADEESENALMPSLVQFPSSPAEITDLAAKLRASLADDDIPLPKLMAIFESWAAALSKRELDAIPGVAFLKLWLRRGTIEPIIIRELGKEALTGEWGPDGRARLRAFPVGIVGHWPAGNIEIQPILSMTCGLLGGNAALVRIPSGLVDVMEQIMATLAASADGERLMRRITLLSFDHDRRDLQEAMANAVDGAMIWGGREAVLNVRSLPFPPWAKLAVFGPRLSVAAMDAAAWGDTKQQEAWCQRIARDVWQFDQQACSSPQTLFLEKKPGCSSEEFIEVLRRAFETENRAHPREAINTSMTSAIVQARASWLVKDPANRAIFPQGPDWTILIGSGPDIPAPTQGKTLTILEVDDLRAPVSKFDGNVQTLGLGMADAQLEAELALLAGKRGVDRIAKLGRMHLFVPPWDGVDLIRPMVRLVRHMPSTE
jgi:hypothetical protein